VNPKFEHVLTTCMQSAIKTSEIKITSLSYVKVKKTIGSNNNQYFKDLSANIWSFFLLNFIKDFQPGISSCFKVKRNNMF